MEENVGRNIEHRIVFSNQNIRESVDNFRSSCEVVVMWPYEKTTKIYLAQTNNWIRRSFSNFILLASYKMKLWKINRRYSF